MNEFSFANQMGEPKIWNLYGAQISNGFFGQVEESADKNKYFMQQKKMEILIEKKTKVQSV